MSLSNPYQTGGPLLGKTDPNDSQQVGIMPVGGPGQTWTDPNQPQMSTPLYGPMPQQQPYNPTPPPPQFPTYWPQNPPAGQGIGPTGLDIDAFTQAQKDTEAAGRRITMDEWMGMGGSGAEYHQLYGLDPNAFAHAQQATESTGTRISPEDWMRMGGNYQDYHKLYNTTPLSADPFASPQAPAGSIPTPTDAGSAIAGQGAQDARFLQQQMNVNRVNEMGPYGSASYITNPDGSVTRRYDLSPQQKLINSLIESRDIGLGGLGNFSLNQAINKMASPMDYDALPKAPWEMDPMSKAQEVGDAIMQDFERDMGPRFQQQNEMFEQKMADMGIPRGSERYDREKRSLQRYQEETRQDALSRAVQERGQEHTRLDRLGQSHRDSAMLEALQRRSMPLQELGQIAGLQRGVQNPSFSGIGQIQVPNMDVAGIGLGYRGLAQQLEQMRLAQQIQQENAIFSKQLNEKPRGIGGGGVDPWDRIAGDWYSQGGSQADLEGWRQEYNQKYGGGA